MVLKYLLVGVIILAIFAVGILGAGSIALARTLTVTSISVNNQTGGNVTSFNGTSQTLEGTDEEIASQYYNLGEEFDKKSGVSPGDPVTFMFRNNSNVTIPYAGAYKNSASDDLLYDALNGTTPVAAAKLIAIPIGSPGDTICWISFPQLQMHYVCT